MLEKHFSHSWGEKWIFTTSIILGSCFFRDYNPTVMIAGVDWLMTISILIGWPPAASWLAGQLKAPLRKPEPLVMRKKSVFSSNRGCLECLGVWRVWQFWQFLSVDPSDEDGNHDFARDRQKQQKLFFPKKKKKRCECSETMKSGSSAQRAALITPLSF